MARGGWVYDPHSGGVKIPERTKREVKERLEQYAKAHFAGKYTRLDIRFRGHFCYIDAYTEPFVQEGWPTENWPETREEFIERLRNTPTHLCRLRHFSKDSWSFAFFAYSDEKYHPSMFPDGSMTGKPEDAFAVAADAYLE